MGDKGEKTNEIRATIDSPGQHQGSMLRTAGTVTGERKLIYCALGDTAWLNNYE